ncbi:hypothetical protein JCM8202_003598 [Rhodotorula sphaerocarpa]
MDQLLHLVPLPGAVPVRVSAHLDFTAGIRFALESLLAAKPLVLHSLPPPPPSGTEATLTAKQVDSATTNLAKLVSVLEILKREYPPSLEATHSGGQGRSGRTAAAGRGLHQYTRLTTFEAAFAYQPGFQEQAIAGGSTAAGDGRSREEVRQELVQLEWLSGRAGPSKRPRKRHSPCMLVVLSPAPLPHLANHPQFTYQPPDPRTAKPSRKRSRAKPVQPPAADKQQHLEQPDSANATSGPVTPTPQVGGPNVGGTGSSSNLVSAGAPLRAPAPAPAPAPLPTPSGSAPAPASEDDSRRELVANTPSQAAESSEKIAGGGAGSASGGSGGGGGGKRKEPWGEQEEEEASRRKKSNRRRTRRKAARSGAEEGNASTGEAMAVDV